jgi:hypothetical protein
VASRHFFLPKSAQLLASSEACPRQAFKISDKVYGFQFHPEADDQLIQEWLHSEAAEEEIKEIQARQGTSTVQAIEAQIKGAKEGEKSSLKITAAISQLFKNTVYFPLLPKVQKSLEHWANLKTPLLLDYEGADRKIKTLKGKIILLLTIPGGEFIIFKEESALLWPIRMDHVKKAIPLKA